jgi:hypothetical protein
MAKKKTPQYEYLICCLIMYGPSMFCCPLLAYWPCPRDAPSCTNVNTRFDSELRNRVKPCRKSTILYHTFSHTYIYTYVTYWSFLLSSSRLYVIYVLHSLNKCTRSNWNSTNVFKAKAQSPSKPTRGPY